MLDAKRGMWGVKGERAEMPLQVKRKAHEGRLQLSACRFINVTTKHINYVPVQKQQLY